MATGRLRIGSPETSCDTIDIIGMIYYTLSYNAVIS